MIINVTELVRGDCFQFIGANTIYVVTNAREYKSTITGNVYGMPTFGRTLNVVSEDWMLS